jgi:hypothetical protein
MSPQLGFRTLLSFFFIFVINWFFLVGHPMCPILNKVFVQLEDWTMFRTLYKLLFQNTPNMEKKNVSFLPFPVLMNTQPTNTIQKLCKCIMRFYDSNPKTPIPNNNKLPYTLSPSPHMFIVYNHFYCWLCSQTLPLINVIRPCVRWELSMPL